MKKSIVIIGNGFVGGSLTAVMSERGFEVYVYDKAGKYVEEALPCIEYQKQKLAVIGNEKETYADFRYPNSITELVEACERIDGFTKIYFVCVPTPMVLKTGECDTSIVEDVLKKLASVPCVCAECQGTGITATFSCKKCNGTGNGERIAVIKSTVPPGSTQKWNKQFEKTPLRIIFNPEFLTEANALDDMRNQNRVILGGPRPWINQVKQLFQTAFPKVPIIKTGSTTAEMIKYMTNIHLAIKVLLANEFYQICETLDRNGMNIDYDKCVEYATMDERLGKSHWKVPGPMPLDNESSEPAFGVGGSCFVKDLNALISLAKSIGVDPKIMEAAWSKNLEVRPQRDWEKLVGRAVQNKSK